MKCIITFFAIVFTISSLAQTDSLPYKYNHWEPNFKNYTKMKRQHSLYCIEALNNNGALLVRLKTRKPKIEALRAEGFTSDADRIEAEQLKLNREIVSSFRERYKFSRVYFFFAEDTESLRKGVRKGIFLNDDLTSNPLLEVKEDFYLIAEFDNVESDPIGFPLNKEALEQVVVRPSVMKGRALVVRDKYFIQLRHPFPFYVMAPDNEWIWHYVESLEKNLVAFYNNRNQVNFFSPTVTLFWFDKTTDWVKYYYKD